MSSGGDDDERRVKRRHDPNAPRQKQPSRRGTGRNALVGRGTRAGNSSGAARARGSRDDVFHEETLQRAGRVIPPDACPHTPPHIQDYDSSYMVKYSEDVMERRTDDTRPHQVVNYKGKRKVVEEAREEDPFEQPKDLGIDYRF